MVDEIGNFECSQCGEPIKHDALENATAQLTQAKGIVFICAKCIGTSQPAVVLTSVKTRIFN